MENQLHTPPYEVVDRLYPIETASFDSPGWTKRQRLRRSFYRIYWLILVQAGAAIKRTTDFCVALVLLVAFAPLFFLIGIVLKAHGAAIFRSVAKVGRWCESFSAYEFSTPDNYVGSLLRAGKLVHLPLLFNILKGDLSFIGPRAVAPGELPPREHVTRARYDVRPGLVCLWWVRSRANINYETESEADREYVENQTVGGDVGLALRAVPTFLYGRGLSIAPDRVNLLGITLHNLTMSDTVETIKTMCDQNEAHKVYFVNPHCANIAYHDPEYLQILQHADLALADGIGIKIAGKLLGQEIKQNVNGTDLFPRLCAALSHTQHRVFLLGGQPGVPEKVQQWISDHYPAVAICGWHHGYFLPTEEHTVVQQIADSKATLLLVALGVPRQEKWIHRHLEATGVKVALGVGGLFDFYSGRIPRAPQWLREVGGEWLYRLCQEPQRMWKRYIVGNAMFLIRLLRYRTNGD